jgi:hypothetical protein
MNQFITKFASRLSGVLSGFDRIVFRGNIRSLCYAHGMDIYLRNQGVLYKDFANHVHDVSKQVEEASLATDKAEGLRPIYLASSGVSKENIAREIAQEKNIKEGTVCILTAVEPCKSFEIYSNKETKKLELQSRMRKCKHIYHYFIHPTFGFMNARIQTWFPFRIQMCLNGREWLARQMDQAGMQYQRADNCFPWVEDFEAAQALLDQQLQSEWPSLLDELALRVHPLHETLKKEVRSDYYWSCYQSEWATDLVFSDPAFLETLYPRVVQQSITTFGCTDVLRFLGKPVTLSNQVRQDFDGELSSDFKERSEGIRVKHWVNGNSVKLYDKARTERFAVLRGEATINHPMEFRCYRAKEGGPPEEKSNRVLRRGVADMYSRAQVSDKITERYFNALSTLENEELLKELLAKVTVPAMLKEKRVRALRPFDAEDTKLLSAVSHGEFVINGLRNRDLQKAWFESDAETPQEARRRSGFITRKLRLLRAHGIVKKITGTHRYQVTTEGRKLLTALLSARETSVTQLTSKAA